MATELPHWYAQDAGTIAFNMPTEKVVSAFIRGLCEDAFKLGYQDAQQNMRDALGIDQLVTKLQQDALDELQVRLERIEN